MDKTKKEIIGLVNEYGRFIEGEGPTKRKLINKLLNLFLPKRQEIANEEGDIRRYNFNSRPEFSDYSSGVKINQIDISISVITNNYKQAYSKALEIALDSHYKPEFGRTKMALKLLSVDQLKQTLNK